MERENRVGSSSGRHIVPMEGLPKAPLSPWPKAGSEDTSMYYDGFVHHADPDFHEWLKMNLRPLMSRPDFNINEWNYVEWLREEQPTLDCCLKNEHDARHLGFACLDAVRELQITPPSSSQIQRRRHRGVQRSRNCSPRVRRTRDRQRLARTRDRLGLMEATHPSSLGGTSRIMR